MSDPTCAVCDEPATWLHKDGRWLCDAHFKPVPDDLTHYMQQAAAERALADDLADVLARMVVGWEDQLGFDLAQHPDVQRVSKRYREARGMDG